MPLSNYPCRVCGRPVAQRGGRGRKKEAHAGCVVIASRLAELEKLLNAARFGDASYVRRLRGDLFSIVNGPLRADRVVISPSDDSEG